MSLLSVKNLSVSFQGAQGLFTAVEKINFDVQAGDVLALVGESGSGKSVSMLALMGLLPDNAIVQADDISFDGKDLLRLSLKERRKIIGKDLAMIFQEPMSALNPCLTIEAQMMEITRKHLGGSRKSLRAHAIAMMERVGIVQPEKRLKAYPHQFSGGMAQRIMIAMALSCKPKLLIADEPTTALDVTIQAQILDLLRDLQKDYGMGLIVITHNMGIVAQMAEKVMVQYAGRQVEYQSVIDLFENPKHPYTQALLASLPGKAKSSGLMKKLPTIEGVVPGQYNRPKGCLFAPRCKFATPLCQVSKPELRMDRKGFALCHYPLKDSIPFRHPLYDEVSHD